MFRLSVLSAFAFLASIGSLAPAAVAAAPYPDRPIRLVVPYASGGGTDIIARLLAEKLQGSLGQPVIVENRPGAGGTIGSDAVAKSPADGYTLLLGGMGPMAINPTLMAKMPYVPTTAFVPVAMISGAPFVLVAGHSAPATDLTRLLAYARENEGRVTAANAGEGSPHHLCVSLLAKKAGVTFLDIPYKGATPAINDVLGGNVQILCENVGTIRPFVEAGKVHPLAVSTRNRVSLMPDVPSFGELGISGIDFSAWFMVAAPAGTPEEIVGRLNKSINEMLRQPDFIARLHAVGNEPIGGSSQAASEFLEKENREWPPLLKSIYGPR